MQQNWHAKCYDLHGKTVQMNKYMYHKKIKHTHVEVGENIVHPIESLNLIVGKTLTVVQYVPKALLSILLSVQI